MVVVLTMPYVSAIDVDKVCNLSAQLNDAADELEPNEYQISNNSHGCLTSATASIGFTQLADSCEVEYVVDVGGRGPLSINGYEWRVGMTIDYANPGWEDFSDYEENIGEPQSGPNAGARYFTLSTITLEIGDFISVSGSIIDYTLREATGGDIWDEARASASFECGLGLFRDGT